MDAEKELWVQTASSEEQHNLTNYSFIDGGGRRADWRNNTFVCKHKDTVLSCCLQREKQTMAPANGNVLL